MVPPLLLDVQPDHVVLDACASPGSKTAQLVEALHTKTDPITGEASFVPFPSGIVIANDSEYTRAQLLVHQSARLPSPSLMVTNLDASLFPALRVNLCFSLAKVFVLTMCVFRCSWKMANSSSSTASFATSLAAEMGLYAKTLAYGRNGALGTGMAFTGSVSLLPNRLFISFSLAYIVYSIFGSLQLRILLRAMNMLRPGGKIVYSTCSMNPLENEAVLAAALNVHPGPSIRLSSSPPSHVSTTKGSIYSHPPPTFYLVSSVGLDFLIGKLQQMCQPTRPK